MQLQLRLQIRMNPSGFLGTFRTLITNISYLCYKNIFLRLSSISWIKCLYIYSLWGTPILLMYACCVYGFDLL